MPTLNQVSAKLFFYLKNMSLIDIIVSGFGKKMVALESPKYKRYQ